jgi:hypothetical protein
MADYDRLIRLFGYETDNGRNSILWYEPGHFSRPGGQQGMFLDDAFDGWKAQKRAFTRDEVLQGQWVKVGDHGHHRIVRCHPNGTLTETDLFNKDASWQGQWQLVSAVLRMNIGEYELDIVANREGALHSGIEFQARGYQPNAYFKVIHLV